MATHLPMISRILHLLVIDILAVGVAMRRNPESVTLLGGQAEERLDESSESGAKPVQGGPQRRAGRQPGRTAVAADLAQPLNEARAC